jgi:hypothetical protein
MKSILFGLIISTMAFANGLIEEQVIVENYNKKQFAAIKAQTELTIDHVHGDHFELYGPSGMTEWLDTLGVTYFKVDENHKHIDDFSKYQSFADITKGLKKAAKQYPSIMKLFSIGKSVQGRELWVMKISDNVNVDESEPEFKYISSMHGDEIVGRELTMELIEYIGKNYKTDAKIQKLVNNTEIFIMPSMNPDGSKAKRRYNANRIDLNRNFPDWKRRDSNNTRSRQVETIAVMNWQKQRNFALSANFHGGAVVVNYPWDTTKDRHPFDKLVKDFSKQYADLNPGMRNSREFRGGITNGADWYELNGGMQDWSYYWHNDLQVTVELSERKWPNYSQISSYWKDNRDSLIKYIELIHQGAGFKINDSAQGKVAITQTLANGSTKNLGSYGFTNGEFYKVLENGAYTFTVESGGSKKTVQMQVNGSISSNGNILKL